ncbi:hypothetical protein [Rhizobium sp. L1K21]|uniref:hypothetical protein n=1 Tax=Rhizobium sp. L1K21 TaxID=2954933 RepID=UPI002092A065|nr:hypothetical protein [Rhizobium sp. L1K21]MCO6187114.1 hypothetical protein [Rhizobium sp. L1K21]
MSASLARFLKDFSEPELPPVVFEEPSPAGFDMESLSLEPDEPPVDIEAERAEAYAEGRAAAEAELRDQFQAQIAEMEEARRNELETIKAENAAALANISAKVDLARDELIQSLSAAAMNALLPLIDEMLANKAIEILAKQVRDGFSADDGVELRVHGPAELTEAFVTALGEADFTVKHIEADSPDLTVVHGDMIFATRLSAWIDGVRELLQ